MRARHKASLGALVALAVLLALRLLREDGEAPPADPARAASIVEAPASPGARPPPARVAPISAQAQAVPAPPVFDLVRVEKEEVCEGEENLVTVHAHTIDGNDAFLQYTVAGEAGAQVPVRAFLGREGKPTAQYAVAFTRNNVATRIELPAYRVKNCRPARVLVVTVRMLPNSSGEREFTAAVQTLEGAAFTPAWYEWSFGDGAASVTPGPIAAHDYSGLPQKTAFTDLLVKVKALDGSGESVEGRLPLHIRNVAFFARQRGVAILFAEPTPRFPAAGPDGIVRQTFRLWHAEDSPVQITGATLARLTLPPGPGSVPEPPKPVAVDPARLLRALEIPPGVSLEQPMEYDFAADPAAYGAVYEIQGVTVAGMQARGEIAILRPPPRPTRENSVPVDDPAMAMKIRRAMEILGKQTVSQDDLFRLEREGKLQ